ncbi:hypothetical protein NX801_15540 [Streptomyces sp. LP05-1]|uniref:Ig-like domain-containing protein n=1 Tax=Streptomyces pyxinae TaxID=2970734 RepID=A0ABT2CIB0_9ACTN|nr:hypothetical protein [Streptomyces sp. LP05-1]MCS0637050.1 hypothetical protein [Streptomyces sp. LP05-1]
MAVSPRTSRAPFSSWTARSAAVAVLVTATLLAATTTAGGAAAPRAQAGGRSLACRAATPAGHPITLSPALGLTPRTVKLAGELSFTGCSSPDGTHRRVRSGMATLRGSGRASCSETSGISGEMSVRWYDGNGRRIGTSTVRPSGSKLTSRNPGDALLTGEVVRGTLSGARVSGSATPTSDVTRCAKSGLRSLTGRGSVRFTS